MPKPVCTYAIEFHDAANGETLCTVTRIVWNPLANCWGDVAITRELTRFFAPGRCLAIKRAMADVRAIRKHGLLPV